LGLPARQKSPVQQTISVKDQTVKVWDAGKGTEIFSLKGHMQDVTSAAFSPDGKRADGKRIVSGNGDDILRLWDVSPK
jgi:WD40 repeat protein